MLSPVAALRLLANGNITLRYLRDACSADAPRLCPRGGSRGLTSRGPARTSGNTVPDARIGATIQLPGLLPQTVGAFAHILVEPGLGFRQNPVRVATQTE